MSRKPRARSFEDRLRAELAALDADSVNLKVALAAHSGPWPAPAWLAALIGAEAATAAAGPVQANPRMAASLRRRRIDPQLLDERQLAVMVHQQELWAPTWGWRLTPVCIWGRPVEAELIPTLGPGWLMDGPARRILAGAQRGELWIAGDPIDWLTLATHWGEVGDVERGVLGIVRMPWCRALAQRVPDGTTIVVSSERQGVRVLHTLGNRRVAVRLWRVRA